jgi:hypothetical protein
VHAFTSSARVFFSPAPAACLRLYALKELVSQPTHLITDLYAVKIRSKQGKLFACVVTNFVVG